MKPFLFFTLCWINIAYGEWIETNYIPLKDNSVTLTYTVVNNPRFEAFTPKQIKQMLQESTNVARKHLGLNIEFVPHKQQSIATLFSLIPPMAIPEIEASIYNFKHHKGDKKRLVQALQSTLQQYEFDAIKAFASPYLPKKSIKTIASLSEALVEAMLQKLDIWLHVTANDGKPVIDNTRYNEWAYWDALGHFYDRSDIIITNQLIASSEYYGLDIHSSLRGGVVAGTTTYRKLSPYNGFVFLSTYIFTNKHPFITQLRDNQNYSDEEASKLAGAYLVHELGHLLFRYLHPFQNKHCVMAPATLLHFKKWYETIDSDKCPKGIKGMIAGEASLPRNDSWY